MQRLTRLIERNRIPISSSFPPLIMYYCSCDLWREFDPKIISIGAKNAFWGTEKVIYDKLLEHDEKYQEDKRLMSSDPQNFKKCSSLFPVVMSHKQDFSEEDKADLANDAYNLLTGVSIMPRQKKEFLVKLIRTLGYPWLVEGLCDESLPSEQQVVKRGDSNSLSQSPKYGSTVQEDSILFNFPADVA
jgi:hypothetical protein